MCSNTPRRLEAATRDRVVYEEMNRPASHITVQKLMAVAKEFTHNIIPPYSHISHQAKQENLLTTFKCYQKDR